MPDYSKAVIYTIRSGDSLYVGSTTSYAMRKYNHKDNIYNEKKRKYFTKLYKTIRENNGEWDMKPHKEFPCENKTQLTIEEERVRREMNADLNDRKCIRENEKEGKKNDNKKYREKNKDKIKIWKNELIECECGCELTKNNLSTHRKSKKHMNLMESIDPAKIGLH